jgi:hypothetical protein
MIGHSITLKGQYKLKKNKMATEDLIYDQPDDLAGELTCLKSFSGDNCLTLLAGYHFKYLF